MNIYSDNFFQAQIISHRISSPYKVRRIFGMVIGLGQLMNKLELVVTLKPGKNKEFKQSLQFLREKIKDFSASFNIDESKDTGSFCILIRWETDVQMNQALKSDEFKILSGAIDSLCAKTMIILDDKQIGKHISGLKSISQV